VTPMDHHVMCHDKFNLTSMTSFTRSFIYASGTLSQGTLLTLSGCYLGRCQARLYHTFFSFNPLPTCHSFPSAPPTHHGTAYPCARSLITSDHSTGEPGEGRHLSRRPNRGMMIVGVTWSCSSRFSLFFLLSSPSFLLEDGRASPR